MHLMTGPADQWFSFPETLNIEGRGKTKLIVSRRASNKCFVTLKNGKICENIFAWRKLAQQICSGQ